MGVLAARIALENNVNDLINEAADKQRAIDKLLSDPEYLGVQRRIRILGNAGKLGAQYNNGFSNYYYWADANDNIWADASSDAEYKKTKPKWDNWESNKQTALNRINYIQNTALPAAQKALDDYIKNNPNDPGYNAYIAEQNANAAQAQKDAEIQKANYAAGNTKNILIAVVIIVVIVSAFALFKPTKSAA